MHEPPTSAAEAALRQLSSDPVVADFAGALPNLLGPDGPTSDAAVTRMAERLGTAKKEATFRISLGSEPQLGSTIRWTREGAAVSQPKSTSERPNLEIITTPEVWGDILSGKLSPIEAFGRGRLRVRGDIVLARRIARALKGEPEEE